MSAAYAPNGIAAQSRSSEATKTTRRVKRIDVGGLVGLVLTAVVILGAAFAPYLMPHNPYELNLNLGPRPPVLGGGPGGHVLGTDPLGRDILSRILLGSRVSLGIGLVATTLAGIVGIPLGLLMGLLGGAFDGVLARIADVQLALPGILLALALLVVLGPSTLSLIIVLALSYWVSFGRIVRGEVMSLVQREYVEAARAAGAGQWRIMRRHLLPNLVSSITVLYSVTFARVVIAEASLSFLGFGVQPPTPSWGGMIAAGREYLAEAWWVATLPGVALLITVLAVNLVGDWIRDRFDPKGRS